LLEVKFADIESENALPTDSKGRAFENRIPKPYFSSQLTSGSYRIPRIRICRTWSAPSNSKIFHPILILLSIAICHHHHRFGHTNPSKDYLSSSIISASTTP
jgi:hypothetical protein